MLENKKILILDHAIFVNEIPIHGPGLNIYNTFKTMSPESIEYFAHCLDGINKSYSCKYCFEKEEIQKAGLPLKFIAAPFSFVYCICYSFLKFLFASHDICIAVNPLNFLSCYMLKCFGRVKKTVFYTADYSENRFSNKILNNIYKSCDRFSVKYADSVWNVSKTICATRKQQGVSDSKNCHIPNSPVLSHFEEYLESEHSKYQIVYVFGTISKSSDLFANHQFDLLMETIDYLVEKEDKIQLLLIGRGNFEKYFQSIMTEKLLKHIRFCDIEDRKVYIKTLCASSIGVAFYNLSGAAHLKFGDSMKIREYFAAGLPAITTPGHSLAYEIKEHQLGFVVETLDDCKMAFEKLLFDENLYSAIQQRVKKYAIETDKVKTILPALEKLD